MQGAGQQLLAGAALAQQQDADIRRRHPLHHAAHLGHLGADGDHAFQGRYACLQGQAAIFGLQILEVEGARDDQAQDVGIHGLLIEVVGTHGDRFDGVVAVVVAGNDNNLGFGSQGQDLLHQRQAFGGIGRVRRQSQVQGHYPGLVTAQVAEGGVPIASHEDFVVHEAPLQLALEAGIVLHHQQGFLVRPLGVQLAASLDAGPLSVGTVAAMTGSLTRNSVPRRGALSTAMAPPRACTNSRLS